MGSHEIPCTECGTPIFESSGVFYDTDSGQLVEHDEKRCRFKKPKNVQELLVHILEEINHLSVSLLRLQDRVDALDGRSQ